MSLAAGTKLGSYEVLAQIGAGGMGEVYQAHDTKLGRDVAIKVLPEAFAHDPERLSRFQREAKMLAALNHPNIATIHGLEQSGGASYLVMELVPGETLADRIKAGPVPVEETLKIAVQIAEALEAAHEKNIIHRDLKPANVKVTPEEKVKVLDFGLAKAFEGDLTNEDMNNSPTLSMAATMQGVILGTAAYMSPEQARGKATDKRTDVWAFGCVLYELLAGKQAFHGETATDIFAKILSSEPEWKALPPTIPGQIHTLLQRCLQKDKALRLRDAGDARIEIQEGLAAPKDAVPLGAVAVPKSKWLGGVAAALGIISAIALLGWWRATRPVNQTLRPLVRLDIDLGFDELPLSSLAGTDVILSPDGMRLVYVSKGKLFTRRLDQSNATELPGTDGASAPFFSPDGQWVAFFVASKLKKISVVGGAAIILCDVSTPRGGSWGEDGNIVAALSVSGGLSRVPAAGGSPTPLTDLDRERGEITHRWPQVLLGRKAVVFTARTQLGGYDQADIEVMSLVDHHRKTLVRGGTFGRYLPSGHLVYVNQGTLFAVPFDLGRLEVRGEPIPVLDQIGYSVATGAVQLDFSQMGSVVYHSGGASGGLTTVQWLNASGKTQPLLAKPDSYVRPRLSPDGTRLAFSTRDIWVHDWRRDTMTRLTFEGLSINPLWSLDGRYLLFEALGGIFWTRSDGSGKPQQLTQSKNLQWPWSFTPDGKRLAFAELNPQTGYDLWTVPVDSDATGLHAGEPEPFLQTPFNEVNPSFSPDGRWLAYDSDEAGSYQVYVRAFPDKGGKWQISNNGGGYPEWAHNGHELFFRTVDNQIMVASYTVKGDSFVADKARAWSEKRIANVGLFATYDLTPDGKRIVAVMPEEVPPGQSAQNHVIFLENFFDEVRRRTATQVK